MLGVLWQSRVVTAFVFWLQKDWMFGEEAAVHFARELENGASFAGLCRSEAGKKMAPAQIWAWRRLHDEYRLLKRQIDACAPRFGSALSDALSVRLACAVPAGLPAGDETRWLAVVRVLFSLGMQRARVRFSAAGSLPVHASFSELLSLHASPGELPAHRVLSAVRAASAGVLHVDVEPPVDELARQWGGNAQAIPHGEMSGETQTFTVCELEGKVGRKRSLCAF